jgi:hypothetical protein
VLPPDVEDFYGPLGAPHAGTPALLANDELPTLVDVAFTITLDGSTGTPALLADDELPTLIDVTPLEFDSDFSWPRWLADADAWLGDPGHIISAHVWLGHISALWESPRRIHIAGQVLAFLSGDTTARSRRAGPVLHFIAAAFWTNLRLDGRIYLGDAYRTATDLTTHALLSSRATIKTTAATDRGSFSIP